MTEKEKQFERIYKETENFGRVELVKEIQMQINENKKLTEKIEKQREVIENIKNTFDDGRFEDGCDCLLIEEYVNSYLKGEI